MTRPVETLLTSFFERLTPLQRVVRIILSEARLSALLEFRGDSTVRVLLDFTRTPCRIVTGNDPGPGQIVIAAASQVMHRILKGDLAAGEAFGRRELLLRGSAADLAYFIPLLDFAPLLYREHLADMGVAEFARDIGRVPQEVSMSGSDPQDRSFQGDPILLRSLTRSEQALFRLINEAAYVAGYGMGRLRHRYLRNLSLFDVLAALSRGVAAASPDPAEPG